MSEKWQLQQKQSLPLNIKIKMSQRRIKEWYNTFEGNVYVSFSGGKDSTVLLHLVRTLYPNVPAVFVDTGLEYPEIREFVKNTNNVIWIKPSKSFKTVIETYGYPVVSKKIARMIRDIQNPTDKNKNTVQLYLTGQKSDGSVSKYFKLPNKWKDLAMSEFRVSEKCCDIMKKKPFREYEKISNSFGFVGTLASESNQREISYLKTGCNNFKQKISKPISFWREEDIWSYIGIFNISYSKIYDMGEKHTGCMFCMFGVHLEKEPNRFQRMRKTHPKQYNYCIEKLGLNKILDFIGVNYL